MPKSQDAHVSVEELTPEEASRIIHSHRKVRYGTACWPCRQRKVKCDNKQPCENCVKREHPQLCSYKPNRSNVAKQGSADSTHGQKRPHSPDESTERERHGDHQPNGWPRALDQSESMEIPRFVGQNSIPALLRDQSSPNETKDGIDIRRDMRPIWGLDNSAPFPLMSSHHLDRMTREISAELPSDREVLKLFKTYKEVPHPFWGFVIDIEDLESRLMIYLEERAKNAREGPATSQPVSASWLAILFAVLAVGSQYHDSPYHIRTTDSQRYMQISMHFLRLGNFLLRPNLDSIQALLMTSFVLLNDMKAEASWALLALTCRLAQSLGLHRSNPQDGRESSSGMSTKDYVRRKLWWTCQWHDTLTSLSFDRPNMTNIQCCAIPLSSGSIMQGFTYLEAMYHLTRLISEKLNPDATATVTYEEIMGNCEAIESIRERMYPQLRSKEAAKTAVDRLQHYACRLHTAFVVSVCCRPALRSDCTRLSAEEKKILSAKCKENLTETVRMFLSMHNISVIPTRSWAFTYHGLSSAVLLGIICETKTDPEVRGLQGDLISALSAAAAKERSSPPPGHIKHSEKDIELSGPLSRALTALKNIYDYGSLHGLSGMKSENPSGSRTPVTMLQNVPHASQQQKAHGMADPHQDAALAMTELQNGATMPDFSSSMSSYTPAMQQQQQQQQQQQPQQQQSQQQQQQQPPQPMGMQGVTDMSQMDPAAYMSPMDLYDSIFWESPPDPFYTGTDMNFDFLAQPPPGQPPQQQFYF